MPALRQKALQVVPAPLIEVVPQAPLAPEMPNPTVEFTCGNCGAVLIRAGRRKRLSSRGPLQLLRLVQFDRRLTPQPVRRNWIGAGASLGVPSARLNDFAFRGELAGCNSWPRFNASASSRHALASLSIKARCLGSSAFAAAGGIPPHEFHTVEPELACQPPTHSTNTWYQDAAFRFVIYRTNERKISGLHRKAGLLLN